MTGSHAPAHDGRGAVVATLATDRISAERLFAALGEALDPEAAAWSLFESGRDRWSVTVHFAASPDQAAIRNMVADAIGREAADALLFEAVATKDWVKASLEGLPPVFAGRFVVHGAHDRERAPPNRIGIEIEAALAFGTGHHGTTQGCLLALDAWLKRRRAQPVRHAANASQAIRPRILDLGAGTGVLSIAAARALHAPVIASDIDRQAVRTARANARLNGVVEVEFIQADGLKDGRLSARRYDLVLANILLGPLRRLARPIAQVLAPGGEIILSGLLAPQASAAMSAYRTQGLRLERRILRDGWATLVLRRGR